ESDLPDRDLRDASSPPFLHRVCCREMAGILACRGSLSGVSFGFLHLYDTAGFREHPDEKRLEGLSKQLDWDVRTIQRWFRQRRNQEKPSTLARFCESMWRFTFYLYIFTYGVRFLKKTPWLWNTKECWYNYPYQPLTVDIHYYYMLELSFYLSLLFSRFTDIRRKDFLIMFLHHVAAISLIVFSYVNNMARVGTLVMCLHDAADVLIEAAKMANYAKCQILCNLLFAMFAILFITSRLGVYPIW
ncbi:Ceramide synthase 6, partial [Xenoophorus captivus]